MKYASIYLLGDQWLFSSQSEGVSGILTASHHF